MNSLKFIRSLFSPKTAKKVTLFFNFQFTLQTCINMEIVIALQLAKIRPSSVKIREHKTLGIQQQQSIVALFLHVYILLRKNFPFIY